MSKSICVHCTEPELETREKRRDLFGFVGRDVENAQHIEMDTSGGWLLFFSFLFLLILKIYCC